MSHIRASLVTLLLLSVLGLGSTAGKITGGYALQASEASSTDTKYVMINADATGTQDWASQPPLKRVHLMRSEALGQGSAAVGSHLESPPTSTTRLTNTSYLWANMSTPADIILRRMAIVLGSSGQAEFAEHAVEKRSKEASPPTGIAYPVGARRRRTKNLIWDCDFEANWISGLEPTWEMLVPIEALPNDYDKVHPENFCKDKCMLSALECTGFWLIEEGTVPGQGTHKCGLYTTDMNEGTKMIRHGTSSGLLCLRIGKNFECAKDQNMITNNELRLDFSFRMTPSDGSVRTNNQALEWCKAQCDTKPISCVTFWFQQWLVRNEFGIASEWKCGFYSSAVDASLRTKAPDLAIANGCICDAV